MALKTDREELDTTIRPDGQQRDYLVLSDEERAKGFVRPVRISYIHVGIPGPKYELRDLNAREAELYTDYYDKFEPYPAGGATTGRFWSNKDLERVGKGCGAKTSMPRAIAETYAREPRFYGSTYCAGCGTHLPVGKDGEFVWEDGTRVGV